MRMLGPECASERAAAGDFRDTLVLPAGMVSVASHLLCGTAAGCM